MSRFAFILSLVIALIVGCDFNNNTQNKNFYRKDSLREYFLEVLPKICKEKYQTHVTCKEVGQTVWIYLPYTPGRNGFGKTKDEGNDLYLEYTIASFNPYKILEPPELKFITKKILGEIRNLLLHSKDPYIFFVLVVTDIMQKRPPLSEEWYIGYFDDVKHFSVGEDFSQEGYARLVWHSQDIDVVRNENGEPVLDESQQPTLSSYRDIRGKHIDYRDIEFRDFLKWQIEWRIYKRFTIEYNKTPFDLTPNERKDAVIDIIKTVLTAYNFDEFKNFHLKDRTFLAEEEEFSEFSKEDLKEYFTEGITRGPGF